MKYLLIIFCFFASLVRAQFPGAANSSLYQSLPMCSDVPVNWYCNYAMDNGGAVPTFSIVNSNPLNTTLNVCANELVTFHYQGSLCGSDNAIDMGDNCGFLGYMNLYPYATVSTPYVTDFHFDYTYNTPGTYEINVIGGISNYPIISNPYYPMCIMAKATINVIDCNNGNSLAACQGSFRPTSGDYLVSFWVKEELPPGTVTTYASGIDVVLTGMSAGPTTTQLYANAPSNSNNIIIDGWQKVEAKITIPNDATNIEIKLKNNQASVDAYFDDIRFHPFNSSFKSYVYDPVTLRLAAELDERNYATFYEYDEEGQLIRVKKETERGIKTIKETRSGVSK